MNFEAAYLAALAVLIVILGGVVPTAPALNFRDSELAHLRAIVLAVGGTLPGVQLNYHDLVLANWRAAIVARGGTVPGVQLNFRLSHLLHVQAFQLALGNSVAFSGNYHEALLQLVGTLDLDAQTIITSIETADGQSLETTVRYALTAFVVGCKSDSIWTGLSSGAFRFLAGPRTLAGILKAGLGADPTNINFVSGDLARNTGLVGNGTSKYLNTNRAVNADPQNAHHFCVYARRNRTGVNEQLVGARNPAGDDTGGKFAAFSTLESGLGVRIACVPNADVNLAGGNVSLNQSSLIGARRNSSTEWTARSGGTTTTHTQTSTTPVGVNMFVFCYNNGGSPSLYANSRISFYSIGGDIGAGGLALLESRIATYLSSISGI